MISYEQVKELTNMARNYQNDYIVNLCLNGDIKKFTTKSTIISLKNKLK